LKVKKNSKKTFSDDWVIEPQKYNCELT
jgi:hypothetical protein